jgi:predicted PurR-regulated permease PerM
VEQIKNNELQIPLPDEKVKSWPLVGEKIYTEWHDISDDFKKYALIHKDILLDYGVGFVSGVTGFLGTLAAFLVSFLIAMVFMYHADSGYQAALALFRKLVGNDRDSTEIVHMSRDTIRSVVKGILLVALIQAGLAFIGFKAIGLPATGVFTLLILVTAIVQIPAILTMIPAILIAFSIAEPTYAIIFTIYCILVGISDNFLKPMLLGKGLKTPMIVILIGTIGGMLLHGIIGLFVGAVVLAVVYRMYEYWVNTPIDNN